MKTRLEQFRRGMNLTPKFELAKIGTGAIAVIACLVMTSHEVKSFRDL